MEKQTFIREDTVGEATIHRETPIETTVFQERIPFDMFLFAEMQAYLADKSSKGFLLREVNQLGNVLIYDQLEPQKRSYRLLLDASVLESSLLESFYADGWDLVYSKKRSYFGLNKTYAVFSSLDGMADDARFYASNQKYSANLSPARDFILGELSNILLWSFFLGVIWLLFRKIPDLTLLGIAFAEFLFSSIRRYRSYRVKQAFKRAFQRETVQLDSKTSNWQLAKVSQENMENLGYTVSFIAMLLFRVLAD